MKRPSPLPQQPESVRPAARTERAAQHQDASIVGAAPVTPLVRQETADAVSEPALAGAGFRDVLRASRARRRALSAEVKRFTVRSRRRRNLWIGVGAAILLTVAGTAGAAYSPLFAVERIDVVGTSQLDAAAVTDALVGQLGTPLALVDDSAVKAALVRFPLVESYTLEARPPHDLVVNIVERTPIGAMQGAAGFTVVDAAGVALSTTPDAPAGQPVLDIAEGTGSAAFHAAGRVVRALPDAVRAQVTGVSASTPDDVTLTLGASGSTVVWGSAERSAEKALVLDRLMQKSPPDRAREYDVTSPDAGVVRS
ncbi:MULTISPECIES: FtsQ-type POTRA domain-containing protein [Microbacterium]|uniref:FtsQ-type POTRA domain-containing protein n=1 Tax=Microbacterium TaxID=33882 RepID=UPI0006F32388|nr:MULTISPECIES: FtsQ-type POTRA domain-containing protein [Microbacterium]KQR20859.1 cell division protein [Microbacterium sp. Leaf151]MCI9857306.1 FtsQ-type POTRA domain-containing protein [Microbacterium proteolyticum]